jgi:DNA-binding HxlR family transcriptional regulator
LPHRAGSRRGHGRQRRLDQPGGVLAGDEQDAEHAECRRATAIVEVVGRRWNSGILLALARGASRFTEIAASVDGLSDCMLAARLRELEQIGLIDRIVEPTTPVSVRYRLTARGQDLLASLQPLVAYGQRWERAARVDSRTSEHPATCRYDGRSRELPRLPR